MTANQTLTSSITELIMGYYDKLLLEKLRANTFMYQFAEKKALPKHSGNTITWSRYTDFAASSALTEGTTPDASVTSASNVSATIEQYGDYVQPSDVLVMVAIDNQIESIVDLLGYQAALTIDTRIRNGLLGTSSVPSGAKLPLQYWHSGTSAGYIATLSSVLADMTMDTNNLREAAFNLRRLNVRPFEDGCFVAVAHPNVIKGLESDDDWQTWNQYISKETMWKGEVGKVYGVRIVESTNMYSTTSGAGASTTAHFTPVFGKGCYAVTELDGGVKTFIKNPNNNDTSNPLNQWSTVGYKATFATQVLHLSAGRVLVTAG